MLYKHYKYLALKSFEYERNLVNVILEMLYKPYKYLALKSFEYVHNLVNVILEMLYNLINIWL